MGWYVILVYTMDHLLLLATDSGHFRSRYAVFLSLVSSMILSYRALHCLLACCMESYVFFWVKQSCNEARTSKTCFLIIGSPISLGLQILNSYTLPVCYLQGIITCCSETGSLLLCQLLIIEVCFLCTLNCHREMNAAIMKRILFFWFVVPKLCIWKGIQRFF